jgi:thymidylate synthase (FAD)
MNIIEPSVEIMTPINGEEIIKHIERCGRTCYKSEDKITDESAIKFVKGILKSGHLSVIEHFNITVKFICDRGVTHEIVRHRLASYSQESTRYCNYSSDKFNGELTFIEPCFFEKSPYDRNMELWVQAMQSAEQYYLEMIGEGARPEQARSVLPNSLKTEIVMTANLREWRHFLTLRTSKAAHPQIREISIQLLKEFQNKIPAIFDDILIEE